MTDNKPFPLLKYMLLTFAAVALTWLAHEGAHWLAGTLLGNNMHMSMNRAWPESGIYLGGNDHFIVDAAGPVFTLAQGFVFYLLLRKGPLMLFPFLLTCFYMRLLATGISFINPNDEARISQALGWGTFTLPAMVCAFLLLLVYKTVKHRKISARQVILTTLLIMLFSSIIILVDQ